MRCLKFLIFKIVFFNVYGLVVKVEAISNTLILLVTGEIYELNCYFSLIAGSYVFHLNIYF